MAKHVVRIWQLSGDTYSVLVAATLLVSLVFSFIMPPIVAGTFITIPFLFACALVPVLIHVMYRNGENILRNCRFVNGPHATHADALARLVELGARVPLAMSGINEITCENTAPGINPTRYGYYAVGIATDPQASGIMQSDLKWYESFGQTIIFWDQW